MVTDVHTSSTQANTLPVAPQWMCRTSLPGNHVAEATWPCSKRELYYVIKQGTSQPDFDRKRPTKPQKLKTNRTMHCLFSQRGASDQSLLHAARMQNLAPGSGSTRTALRSLHPQLGFRKRPEDGSCNAVAPSALVAKCNTPVPERIQMNSSHSVTTCAEYLRLRHR